MDCYSSLNADAFKFVSELVAEHDASPGPVFKEIPKLSPSVLLEGNEELPGYFPISAPDDLRPKVDEVIAWINRELKAQFGGKLYEDALKLHKTPEGIMLLVTRPDLTSANPKNGRPNAIKELLQRTAGYSYVDLSVNAPFSEDQADLFSRTTVVISPEVCNVDINTSANNLVVGSVAA